MKLIHCADVHLDSAMNTHLGSEKARVRKSELLGTFKRMVQYGVTEQVDAILISGDLFDTQNVSATSRNEVIKLITENSAISFYYLQGNHDKGSFLSGIREIPGNLYTFGEEWTTYTHTTGRGKTIAVTGVELTKDNADTIYGSLHLDPEQFNIVMLHGQIAEYRQSGRAELIHLNALKNRSIHYLALGHVHEYSYDKLDIMGWYCYPGCLEGRGFDEAGEHGFVMLEISEDGKLTDRQFVPFAQRRIYVCRIDISDCMDSYSIEQEISRELAMAQIPEDSLVKLELVGETDVEAEKNIVYLEKQFADQYFVCKIKDLTTYRIDYKEYEKDISLKGAFIRTVMAREDITESEKSEIIRYGLQALRGEEIAL